MWKLVIHQKKRYADFETEQTVEYLGTITELLFLLTRLTDLKTEEYTRYEIMEVKKDAV